MKIYTADQLTKNLVVDNGGTFYVALSGGLDSVVLLHALAKATHKRRLHAVYVNHGLSPNAMNWQAFSEKLACSLGIPFSAYQVRVVNHGKGIEQAARAARYEIFEQLVNESDYLVTGHHLDDQAETVLLRLARGAGVVGLGAMTASRELRKGKLCRPLLTFSKEALHAYAEAHDIEHVTDESNIDERYDRNFLRQQLIPLFKKRWPAISLRLAKSAQYVSEASDLLDEMADEDLKQIVLARRYYSQVIDLNKLRALTFARQKNILRRWFLVAAGEPLLESQCEQIFAQIIHVFSENSPEIIQGEFAIRSYRNGLYLMPNLMTEDTSLQFRGEVTVKLPAECGGKVMLGKDQGLLAELPLTFSTKGKGRLKPGEYQLKSRQGGERCNMQRKAHSQSLKKILQALVLEPWLRNLIPIVWDGEHIAAVGDLFVCEGYSATEDQPGYSLHWIPKGLAGNAYKVYPDEELS